MRNPIFLLFPILVQRPKKLRKQHYVFGIWYALRNTLPSGHFGWGFTVEFWLLHIQSSRLYSRLVCGIRRFLWWTWKSAHPIFRIDLRAFRSKISIRVEEMKTIKISWFSKNSWKIDFHQKLETFFRIQIEVEIQAVNRKQYDTTKL